MAMREAGSHKLWISHTGGRTQAFEPPFAAFPGASEQPGLEPKLTQDVGVINNSTSCTTTTRSDSGPCRIPTDTHLPEQTRCLPEQLAWRLQTWQSQAHGTGEAVPDYRMWQLETMLDPRICFAMKECKQGVLNMVCRLERGSVSGLVSLF